ncbi:hypothetical protein AUC69_12530 [Methyloceanibacter superfactus]|uniref:DUF968 domain-containing protein n=1 Tax=Methyloceanibacter superfactus TaxID=1774969 RepID=A0A1E3VV46_9HYPH|nr:RAD52 family DNA repair protein [Methyloceanibacter superfactus]ODR97428.1 hypothetical protein AUC69_12530 [Methyloceanibacter superfactus]
MPLSDTQIRQLNAKLDPKYVRTRKVNGAELHYVEGWHVIAEANRIFGHDAWDRRTLATSCIWSGASGEFFVAAYSARVRISVRAGEATIVRDGSGSGEGRGLTRGVAHELALKSAETDATKRALVTFGNPFGLPLYDREQCGVRKPRKGKAQLGEKWVLRTPGSTGANFDKPSEYADALRTLMSEARNIDALFAIWELNVEAVRDINKALKQDHLPKSGLAPQLAEHLKRCAATLATPPAHGATPHQSKEATSGDFGPRVKVDKSALAIGELKRIRCREHLRFVARHPCVICGRSPSHAHHLRHAQVRGLGLKVSDEFTVPLCAIHHNEVHKTGREQQWWVDRNVEPLKVAATLWRESRELRPLPPEPASSPSSEPQDVQQ